MGEPDVPEGARLISRDGDVLIFRTCNPGRYHAVHAETGARLTSPGGQGSSDQAVTQALLRLRRAARKRRTCLRCGRAFMSEGPQHRLCSDLCRQPPGGLDEFSLR